MKYFLAAIITFCLGLTSTTGANTIELDVQSSYHEILDLLFNTEFIGRPLSLEALELEVGVEKEYQGTCLSYTGMPQKDSLKIQLLKDRKCHSLGKIFENEMGNSTYCAPATIAVSTFDGYTNPQDARTIRIVAYNNAIYIIHKKESLINPEEPVYCSYPANQDG